MSTAADVATVVEQQLVKLDPEQIVIDEAVDVRPYSRAAGDTDEELAEIERLAQSIEEEGQLQAVRVRDIANEDGSLAYHLIMGHRRVRAIHLLNMRNDKPRKVVALVESDHTTDTDAFRQAALENIQRKQMSPMDLAKVIERVRKLNGWTGTKGTKNVANWLKVSPATVTQHEKLLKLDAESQKLVHTGVLSAEAAMEVQSNVKPEERAAVIEQAKAEQAAAVETSKDQAAEGKGKGRGKAERESKAVKVKHIRSVSRKREAMLTIKARTKQEMMEPWEQMQDGLLKDDADVTEKLGYKDGMMGMFVRTFVSWAGGKVSDKTMFGRLEEMAGVLPKNTRGTTPAKVKKEEKAAVVTKKAAKRKHK